MIPGVQPKLELVLESSTEDTYNWELVREKDGLIKQSEHIKWIEWSKEGGAEELHNEPQIGYSLIMSPFNKYFKWMTTEVTKIVGNKPNLIEFHTTNSKYKLRRVNE